MPKKSTQTPKNKSKVGTILQYFFPISNTPDKKETPKRKQTDETNTEGTRKRQKLEGKKVQSVIDLVSSDEEAIRCVKSEDIALSQNYPSSSKSRPSSLPTKDRQRIGLFFSDSDSDSEDDKKSQLIREVSPSPKPLLQRMSSLEEGSSSETMREMIDIGELINEEDLYLSLDKEEEVSEPGEEGECEIGETLPQVVEILHCPLCSKNLGKLSESAAQHHVNQCLDNLPPSPPRLLTPSTSKLKSPSPSPPLEKDKPEPHHSAMPNAYTALMSGFKEDRAWKLAAQKEAEKGARNKQRDCPFYKIMEGMEIAVDAFRYGKISGVKAYFLTHAHSDHYTNLSSSWDHGPIYCSLTTANLIKTMLNVNPRYVHALPMNETVKVCGVDVTLIDANHCPGSVLFLFEGPQTDPSSPYSKTPNKIFRYLHCGDFRASPEHLEHPAIKGKKIDITYLDTTYCNPKYTFPSQPLVIRACQDLIKSRLEGNRSALLKGMGAERESAAKLGEKLKGWLTTEGPLVAKNEDFEELDYDFNDDGHEFDCNVEEDNRLTVKDEDTRAAKPAAKEEDSDMINLDVKQEYNQSVGFTHKEVLPPDAKGEDRQIITPDTKQENILILIGTYSIGKERLVKGIAKAIGSKIYCNEAKLKIFKCMDDPELLGLLTSNPREANVHVTNLFGIKRETLEDYLDQFKGTFDKIIGLRPTGWTFKPDASDKTTIPSVSSVIQKESKRTISHTWLYPQRDSTERCQAYGVPYSEHSSFFELTCFAVSLDCVRIIATVNVGNDTSRRKQKDWFAKWSAERKRRKENGESDIVPARGFDYW